MKTRRDFLRRLAAAAGGASLLPAIERAAAIDPPEASTFLDAEHVVILMQENRSFDHMFGTLRGVRGFNDPRAVTLPNGKPVWQQTNAAGETYVPFRLDMKRSKATWLGSLPHSWTDQVDTRNHGNHDGWLEAKRSDRPEYAGMPLTLGFHTREDLPFYYAMADAFTVCDQYFCSSLTGTTPNRLFLWSGTSGGTVRNQEVTYDSLVRWKTFPERLEDAGISWRVYQNELGVASGLEGEADAWLSNFQDNPLEWLEQYGVFAHEPHLRHLDRTDAPAAARRRAEAARMSARERSLHEKAFTTNQGDPAYRELTTLRYREGGVEREMPAPKGDPFHRFRTDVENGKLPAVSWLVAPENLSDHPTSAWYGTWYAAEALDILTRNPQVWAKTIFLLTYDENDGYFDHVPPFVAPPASEYHSLRDDLKKATEKDARGGPIGLGYRVPMVIASPWTRGGWVCSQVSDHTSILQLLERLLSHRTGKTIRETNISAWRRTACGDLTAAFRPFEGGSATIAAPGRDAVLTSIHGAQFAPMPAGYESRAMPRQEPGVRPSVALPYELAAWGEVKGGRFRLTLESRASGSPFHVYTPGLYRGDVKQRTRAYAVARGKRVEDSWELSGFENGVYRLCVCGPNGFLREFAGHADDPSLELKCEYVAGSVELRVRNRGRAIEVHVRDRSYGMGDRAMQVGAGEARTLALDTQTSHRWYNFSVTVDGSDVFLRSFAGRVETGEPGFSDPAMGGEAGAPAAVSNPDGPVAA